MGAAGWTRPVRHARYPSALRELRLARCWSQSRLLVAMEDAAERLGVRLATRPSLKTSLSRWENGHQTPDESHRRVLCAVFEVPETDLGLVAPVDAAHGRGASPDRPGRLPPGLVTPEVVAYLGDVLRHYVHADSLLGPGQLLGVVGEQWKQLEASCRRATDPVRPELLGLLVRYSEFLGWLHQDSGDLGAAAAWTGRACEIAQVVDEPDVTSYVLMRRGNVAAAAGGASESLDYAVAALRPDLAVTPQLRALGYRQLALSHAVAGDADQARRAIDDALGVDRPAADENAYCTPPYLRMEAGASLAHLGLWREAETRLAEAVSSWGNDQQRDYGLCLARLADVRAARGEVDGSCAAADAAVTVATRSPSARTWRTLRTVRNRLHPHRRRPGVADSLDRLRDAV